MVDEKPVPPKTKIDFEEKYFTLLKKFNGLCGAIDDLGYEVLSLGKLNRIKNGKDSK